MGYWGKSKDLNCSRTDLLNSVTHTEQKCAELLVLVGKTPLFLVLSLKS